MLLKKQTVWLLTMLSLVVVLSVYYITSPETKNNELTAVQQKAKDKVSQKQNTDTKATSKDGKTVVSQIAGDEEFTALRLQQQDKYSELKAEYQQILASTDLPATDRSKAADQMKKLTETAQKEELLETLIRAMGYDDALVRADGDKVHVTVKSKKTPSKTAANQIMVKVKKEIGDTNYVAVEFAPAK
jgi:stage III sporulation protein AH